MPSHFKTEFSRSVGRACSSSGSTTVGPETTRMAPRRAEIWAPSPNKKYAAKEVSIQVRSTPTLIRRRTTFRTPRTSETRRFKPPSNRITATNKETNGDSRSPSKASGSIRPTKGPARRPTTSKQSIEGMPSRDASHWALMPKATMLPSPSSGSSIVICRFRHQCISR